MSYVCMFVKCNGLMENNVKPDQHFDLGIHCCLNKYLGKYRRLNLRKAEISLAFAGSLSLRVLTSRYTCYGNRIM